MAKVTLDSFSWHRDDTAPYDNPATWDHTVAAGAQLLVLVVETTESITSVKYNSVAMTLIGTGAGNNKSYYLFHPTAGTNGVEIVFGGSGGHQAAAASFIGADLKVPTLYQHSGAGASFSTTITTASSRSLCWDVVMIATNGTNESVTPGMVELLNSALIPMVSSYLPASDPSQPGAQPTITWNLNDSGNSSAFSIDAPPEGPPVGVTPVIMR